MEYNTHFIIPNFLVYAGKKCIKIKHINYITFMKKFNIWQTLLILVMLFPLQNPFHVKIVAIVLKYHLILINTLFLAWMIVFIMANAGTLHAKIVQKRRRYSSSVLHAWPPIIIDLLTVQLMVCKNTSRLPPNMQNHKNI